jgi:hypothetical protein
MNEQRLCSISCDAATSGNSSAFANITRLSLAFFISAFLLSTCISVSRADPILYIYEGVGSGFIGTSSFANSDFRIVGFADTDTITTWPSAAGGPQNTHISTTLAIDALGSFVMLTPAHSWINGNPSLTWGGLGQDHDLNWITFDESELFGYGLDTSFGPVLETDALHIGQFEAFTSGGFLTFTSVEEVSFSARLIPEASTALMSAIGALIGFFARVRMVSQ